MQLPRGFPDMHSRQFADGFGLWPDSRTDDVALVERSVPSPKPASVVGDEQDPAHHITAWSIRNALQPDHMLTTSSLLVINESHPLGAAFFRVGTWQNRL